eukprot:m.205444 g.205444  ORF g.205444 m.205444 type:complete len:323 (-) comp22932_c0_seq1:87-1055(-)
MTASRDTGTDRRDQRAPARNTHNAMTTRTVAAVLAVTVVVGVAYNMGAQSGRRERVLTGNEGRQDAIDPTLRQERGASPRPAPTGRYATEGWGDRLGKICPNVDHDDFDKESQDLVLLARQVLAPPTGQTCEGCYFIEEATIPTKTCVAPVNGRRGLCTAVPVKEGQVVIRRRPTSNFNEANIFVAGAWEVKRLLDALDDDALRCDLALWPYPDLVTGPCDKVLLPFGPTGFMNHADEVPESKKALNQTDDDEGEPWASVYCGFGDVKFVGECTAEHDMEAGEMLTYDYYEDFTNDPLWLNDFKKRSGIAYVMHSHGTDWYL